jgi:CRISPR/Cas system-associated exonuclease Cas4 (RecB family)
MDVTDEQIDKIRGNVTRCLTNFFGSEIFRELKSSDPRTWVKFESMESFDLDGIKVFAIPDFAFEKDSSVRLYDWKSGNRHSSHERQMNCYALLMERRLSRPLPGLDFNIFYLRSGDVVQMTVTEKDREQMIRLIKSSFQDMLSLLEDPSNNLARIDAFPMTSEIRRCETCSFKELCLPEGKRVNPF